MPLGLRHVVNIPPGINKEDDAITSFLYTDADKIRFYQGLPEKIGGWQDIIPNNNQILSGVPRTIYGYVDSNNLEHVLIGTHTRLYSYENGNLYNITPLVTTTTAIPNSLGTQYGTLGTNPFAVTAGSNVVTVTYSPFWNQVLQRGDIISISGIASPIGGIPAASLNGQHSISNVTATTFQFVSNSPANSTASGGTNANLALRIIIVNQMAHGFLDGDRIKIMGAASMGGLSPTDINIESIVRYISANVYAYYMFQTTAFPTSSVSNAGGSATTVQGQIAVGSCTTNSGFGYGGGNFGEGTFGTGKDFNTNAFLPRIWSIDKYGNSAILTPGNQGGVYQWLGDINIAPELIANAPSAVNYLFVAQTENQIVTFGAGGIEDRVYISDSSDITNWTEDATSLVFDRTIEGATLLISHSYVKGQYLLFTRDAVYTMFFVDKPDIWIIKLLTESDGLIGPQAVTELSDAVVWMGQNDFYIYNGSVISQIPNNTLLHWMIDKINWIKSYVCFARKVMEFNEVWWFFPSNASNEPDNYIIWNYQEGHFTNGLLNRTASEQPTNPAREQYLAVGSCDGSIPTQVFQHEIGYADNGNNMSGSLITNYNVLGEGDYIQQISSIIPANYLLPIGTPNSGQSLYSITVNTKEYDGQLNPRVFGAYNVTSITQKIDTRICGRQRQYIYNFSNQVGFRIQKSYEMYKPFTVR